MILLLEGGNVYKFLSLYRIFLRIATFFIMQKEKEFQRKYGHFMVNML